METTDRPELKVTVFSDYICPFCYIGYLRLEKLRANYDLKVNWMMVEIHPDTPAESMPIGEIGYTSDRWHQMMEELDSMAQEEGIRLLPHTTTTNSHKALLLAEAAKEEGRDIFYSIHNRLFSAYLTDGINIGDANQLRKIAAEFGLAPGIIDRAWNDEKFEIRLNTNLRAAHELGVTGTPTFFVGDRKLTGALPVSTLQQAARDSTAS